jgi:hypothetical protein
MTRILTHPAPQRCGARRFLYLRCLRFWAPVDPRALTLPWDNPLVNTHSRYRSGPVDERRNAMSYGTLKLMLAVVALALIAALAVPPALEVIRLVQHVVGAQSTPVTCDSYERSKLGAG